MIPLRVFFVPLADQTSDTVFWNDEDNEPRGEGWFGWFCFPGCMPDSDAFGPYSSEEEAVMEISEMFELDDEKEFLRQ